MQECEEGAAEYLEVVVEGQGGNASAGGRAGGKAPLRVRRRANSGVGRGTNAVSGSPQRARSGESTGDYFVEEGGDTRMGRRSGWEERGKMVGCDPRSLNVRSPRIQLRRGLRGTCWSTRRLAFLALL